MMIRKCVMTCALVCLTAGANVWACGEEKVVAADGDSGDIFGHAVAISGDRAIAGAPLDEALGFNSGAAYIFRNEGGAWVQEQKLLAFDGATQEYYGWDVAISGSTAVVANPRKSGGRGALYVYTRSGAVWSLQQKITTSDAAADDELGSAIAIEGDTIIAGAPGDDTGTGAVYVFTRTAGVWSQAAKVVAPDAAIFDNFGNAVALSGDSVVIGAYNDEDTIGAVYFFTGAGAAWSFEAKFTDGVGDYEVYFGSSVAIDGDTALVGENFRDVLTGVVHVYVRSGSVWSKQATLAASDGAKEDEFGFSVALDGDTAIIGALRDDDAGSNAGCVFVFHRTGSTWSQQAKFVPANTNNAGNFGHDVVIEGQLVVASAPRADDVGTDSGSVSMISLTSCIADITADQVVDGADLSAMLAAWGSSGSVADIEFNGTVDGGDLASLLAAWGPTN